MSKIEVDTIDTQSSTTLQVGDTNTSLIKIGKTGDTVEYPAGTTFTQSGTQNVTAGGAINVKSGGNITIDSGATITNNGTATGFSADLTNLNATNLTSGTVPNARFPSVLPAVSGANLTNIAGQLQWQSGIITAATASVGNNLGYWIDTTSNACVITLPGSAAVGDRIILTDYARTWGTNSVTINPNSLKFQGNVTPQPVYGTAGQSVDIVYSGATQGWIPNSDDDVTLETPQTINLNMLIAGGGGGASFGGGGAGGYRTSSATNVSVGTTITVVVGSGGSGRYPSNSQNSTNGTASSISGSGITDISSAGGGAGGGLTNNVGSANNGASGGGGGHGSSTGDAGGTATPTTSPVQGFPGGAGQNPNQGAYGGGGGGGAGGAGATSTGSGQNSGGIGGAGVANSISGSSLFYCSGGGGSYGGAGGSSMGNDAEKDSTAGNLPIANRGLGGGGGNGTGRNGGTGVVIIAITGAFSGTTTGSPTQTSAGGNTILTFTGSGSYTV